MLPLAQLKSNTCDRSASSFNIKLKYKSAFLDFLFWNTTTHPDLQLLTIREELPHRLLKSPLQSAAPLLLHTSLPLVQERANVWRLIKKDTPFPLNTAPTPAAEITTAVCCTSTVCQNPNRSSTNLPKVHWRKRPSSTKNFKCLDVLHNCNNTPKKFLWLG